MPQDIPTPHRFRNWGRTAESFAEALVFPSSEDEVVELVKRARAAKKRLKVVGGGHSWSDAACTTGTLLNLDRMSRVIAIDRENGRITIEAGMRLKDLNERLAAEGLALPVLGSIAEQSVAGAISTGTHGSAPNLGGLASLVNQLRIVTGTGEVLDVSEKDGDLFQAARVGLGALGIVTRVTLTVVPAFRLEERSTPMPFEQAVSELPKLAAEEEFAKIWWLPHSGMAQVYRFRRTEDASTFSATARWVDTAIVNRFVFPFLLLIGRVLPIAIPLLNRIIRLAYFRPARKVARSDLALTVPMPPVHQEVEYAIPLEKAADALRWVDAMIAREKLHVNFVFEVRFVAPEAALLSPAFGRKTAYLGAYMAQSAGIVRYFQLFEEKMLELGGRPHWGKQFSASGEALRAVHPNLDRFAAIRAELDPDGVFVNAFTERVFAAARPAAALAATR